MGQVQQDDEVQKLDPAKGSGNQPVKQSNPENDRHHGFPMRAKLKQKGITSSSAPLS
jgi:hypothetical protein